MCVGAGDQDQVRRRGDVNIVEGSREVVDDDAIGIGKPLGIGAGDLKD